MAMFFDQRGALIEYLCDSSIDLVITNDNSDSSLKVELILINLGFGTALADDL
jgi:hypothetical protein